MPDPTPFFTWRPHPWHGVDIGPDAPQVVQAYIEITPFDLVKYEIDKVSGFLCVDRPQRTSSQPPSLYGFIPRTLSGKRVGVLTPEANGGDGDPIDICVLSERPINARDILLKAKVIGGLKMVDGGEADDKIVAVLSGDFVWGEIDDIEDLPPVLVERLRHYFATYKLVTGTEPNKLTPYGKAHALKVIEASLLDYDDVYGNGLPEVSST